MQGAWCSAVRLSPLRLRRLRQDNLEAKLSYIVRHWVNKSGVCLFSDTYRKRNSVNVTNSYHASQALKI